MRDNGIPEAQGHDGLNWFAGLAREALGRLVSVRDEQAVDVKQEHLASTRRRFSSCRAIRAGA